MKKVLFSCFVALLLLSNTPAMAHGGGGIEVDKCVITIGNYRMHFTAYEPETVGGQELCWDLPMVGNAILVFDLVEKILRDRPVEVRIVEDQGPGNYKTIVEKPAQKYPRGTIELNATFSKPGTYTAVVILGGDQPLVFKAPLRVGLQGDQATLWIVAGVFSAAVLGFIFWYETRRRRSVKEARA
jgi:hypothetical protein